jgi:hypothetical protein
MLKCPCGEGMKHAFAFFLSKQVTQCIHGLEEKHQ